MQQTIDHQVQSTDKLIVTGRKKATYNTLISPTKGELIVRIGKIHHLLLPGDLFWINQDCLQSLIITPGSEWQTIRVSVRSPLTFSTVAGRLNSAPLLTELVKALTNDQNEQKGRQKNLLVVSILNTLHHILAATSVQQYSPSEHYSTEIANTKVLHRNKNHPMDDAQREKLEICMTLIDAVKQKRSGKKLNQIAEDMQIDSAELHSLAQEYLQEAW